MAASKKRYDELKALAKETADLLKELQQKLSEFCEELKALNDEERSS